MNTPWVGLEILASLAQLVDFMGTHTKHKHLVHTLHGTNRADDRVWRLTAKRLQKATEPEVYGRLILSSAFLMLGADEMWMKY